MNYNLSKVYLIVIVAVLVTGTVTPAFAVHEHTPDDASVTAAKLDTTAISGQNAQAAPATTDTVLVHDIGTGLVKTTLAQLIAAGGGTTTATTLDLFADPAAGMDFNGQTLVDVASIQSTGGATTDAGTVRLANAETISWRNTGGSANIEFSVDAADEFVFGSSGGIEAAELGRVAGVTSAIQTQLDAKYANTVTLDSITTATATVDLVGQAIDNAASLTSNDAAAAAAGALRLGNAETVSWRNAGGTADVTFSVGAGDEYFFGTTALSETELGTVAGVTSAIQTQLNTISPIGTQQEYFVPSELVPQTGAALGIFVDTAGNFPSLTYLVSGDNNALFTWFPPTNWDKGTVIAEIRYTSTASGTVCWVLTSRAFSDTDVTNAASGGLQAVDDIAVADQMNVFSLGAMTIPSANALADGDYVVFDLLRDADGGATGCTTDANAADAEFLGLELNYSIDAATT